MSQTANSAAQLNSNIGFETINVGVDTMHYAYSGDRTKLGLVFVHGTPGGWQAFEAYLENKDLQRDFFMVSVDRLGWGKSTLNSGQVSGDFDQQARSITAVMKDFPNKQWIIVGHSLGASMAPQIALTAGDIAIGMLLLAGSIDPTLGRPRWYNWAANTWLMSKLIGKRMRNSNREIMSLSDELLQMNELILKSNSTTQLIVMQGMQDNLVSPKNASYAPTTWQQQFKSIELIELQEEGHFLPWRQSTLVIETIRKLANVDN